MRLLAASTFMAGQIAITPQKEATRRLRGSRPGSFLPDAFLGFVWRFDFVLFGHGRRDAVMTPRSFYLSAREGFWPESGRKKTGRCAACSVSLNLVTTRSTASLILVTLCRSDLNARPA
jgi:hypothetical protein